MVTTKGALRKYTAKKKKARTSTTTMVKYQKPTARNQRKQIMRNARDIKRMYKSVLGNRVFCDWQYVGQLNAALDTAGFTRTWGCFPLTDFNLWGAVMRQDQNVAESSTTYVRNMQLNFRYQLKASSWAQYNVFIVTPRKDAAGNDVPTRIKNGQFPQSGVEYIEGPDAFNFRLNPAVFKVHFASYRTLTETTLFLPAQQPAGNPFTTYAKGQANVKCGINVRFPVNLSYPTPPSNPWKDLPYMQQAYHKRYFLLVCIVADGSAGTPATTAQFTFDQLATTINDT